MAKTNLGEMACETCGRTVIVKTNEKETLSYRCDYCDAAPYQKAGTLAAKTWLSKVKPIAHGSPAPTLAPPPAADPIKAPQPAPAPAPQPAPAPAKKSSLPW